MLGYSDASLAGLIFHELAHEKLYVKDDSAFNEAFATFVEREGLRSWMLDREDESAWDAWSLKEQREQQFITLVMEAREKLIDLYAQQLDPENMRRRKHEILATLKTRYRELRDGEWDGYAGYDNWFDRDLNNAHLVSIGTYEAGVPAFRRLYQDQHGDLDAFYAAAQEIADRTVAERQNWLNGQ
jgi:predicted aminopeptidase